MSKLGNYQDMPAERAWVEMASFDSDKDIDPKLRDLVRRKREHNEKVFKDQISLYGSNTAAVLNELSLLAPEALEQSINFVLEKGHRYSAGIGEKFGMVSEQPAYKAFHWNNFELGRDMTSIKWVMDRYENGDVERVYEQQPILRGVGKMLDERMPETGMAGALLKGSIMAQLFRTLEDKQNYPWVRENEKEAREVSLRYMDPSLIFTPAARAVSGARMTANVGALEARVPNLIKAAENGHGAFMAAAKDLYGMDMSFPFVRNLVLSAKDSAPRVVAEMLHSIGTYAPEVPAHLRAVNLETYRAPLFKHSNMFWSPTGTKALDAAGEAVTSFANKAVDAAKGVGQTLLTNETMYDTRFGAVSHAKMRALQAVTAAKRDAMNRLGKIPEALANPVHEILSTVSRVKPTVMADGTLDLAPTMASFRANLRTAIDSGIVTKNPKAHAAAEKAVELMAAGWDGKMNFWETMSVNPKFAEQFLSNNKVSMHSVFKQLNTPWSKPNVGTAEQVTGPMLESFIPHVATRNERVAALNAVKTNAEDLSGRLISLRTRMRTLYEFSKNDLAETDRLTPAFKRMPEGILTDTAKARAATGKAAEARAALGGTIDDLVAQGGKRREIRMQELLDAGVSVENPRIPSTTELMTRRKQITSELNNIRDIAKKAETADGVLLHGKEWTARQDAAAKLEKELEVIDTMRPFAGSKEGFASSEFEKAMAKFGGGLPEWAHDAVTNAKALANIAEDSELAAWSKLENRQLLGSASLQDKAALRNLAESTGLANAIRSGRGDEYMSDLEDYIRAGYKTARRTTADLVRFRGTEDPLDSLGKLGMSEAEIKAGGRNLFGKALGIYDRGLSYVRTAQIMNPATIANNAFDTAIGTPMLQQGNLDLGSIRRSIKGGEGSELYTWLGEKVGTFADSKKAALAFDMSEAGIPGWSKAAKAMEEGMTSGENIGRRLVWHKEYNDQMTKLVGMAGGEGNKNAIVAADGIAKQLATQKTDSMLISYADLSGAERIARRAAYYPIFNFGYAKNYMKLALNHGTETVLAAKALRDYYSSSDDERGNNDVGAGLYMNPANSLSGPQMLLRVADASHTALDPETRMGVAGMKIVGSLLGNPVAPVQAALQVSGAAPEQNFTGLSKYDNLLASVSKYLLGKDLAPGDAANFVLGGNPYEVRENRTFQMAKRVAIDYKRRGLPPPTLEQAKEEALKIQMLSAAASLGAPNLSYRGGIGKIMEQEADIQRHVDAAPPEFKDVARSRALARAGYEDLSPLVWDTPGAQAGRFAKQTGANAAFEAAAEMDKPSLFQRVQGLFSDGGGKPPVQPYAVATSTGQPDRYQSMTPDSPRDFPGEARVSRTENGTLLVTGDSMGAMDSNRHTKFLDVTLRGALQERKTGKGQYELLSRLSPNMLQAVRLAGEVDPSYASAIRQYDAYSGGVENASEESFIDASPRIRDSRIAFSKFFENTVANSADPEATAAQGLDFWQKTALAAGKTKLLGHGINSPEAAAGFVDDLSLMLARNRLRDGFGDYYRNRKAEETFRQYPEMNKFVGMLERATHPGPAQAGLLNEAIAFGRKGIESGTILPNVYEFVRTTPRFKDLYGRVEDAAMVHQASGVWDHITLKDRNGRITGVNGVALAEMSFMPRYSEWRPVLQQLASGRMGAQQAQLINSALADMPPDIQVAAVRALTANPETLQDHKSQNLLSMTGIVHPEFSAVMKSFLSETPEAYAQGRAQAAIAPYSSVPDNVKGAIAGMPDLGKPGAPLATPKSMVEQDFGPTRPIGSVGDVIPAVTTSLGFGYQGKFSQGVASPAQFIRESYDDFLENSAYHAARVARGDTASVPPSWGAGIAAKWNAMDGLSKTRVGVGTVQIGYQLASIGMAASGAEMPQEVDAAMSGLSTGMSLWAATGFNPYMAPVAAVAGIAQGFMSSGKRSNGEASYNAREANRINQERLNLERDRYAESLRQQEIRDIRTREGDLAKALTEKTQYNRQAVAGHILNYQRRGTYASKVGMIDAIERELSTALKPRW